VARPPVGRRRRTVLGQAGVLTLGIEHIRTNLEDACARIERARVRGGRGQEVALLAATKYVAVDDMQSLGAAGIRLVGENRLDELEEKVRRFGDLFEYHFIGHLQTRKTKRVLPLVRLIHSVDSAGLVEEIQRRAEGLGLPRVRVLLEVNVSGEESKYGILPGDVEAFLEQAAVHPRVDFAGFMTMAPLVGDPQEARPVFAGLRELRDRVAPSFASRYTLSELSMGMSNDYEVAVEEGATIVRLGSVLFSGA
jgi:PLP dependent protein